MPLLTDEEAEELAGECAPHKIILDGNGLIGTVQAACTLVYQPAVFDLIQSNPELNAIAHKLAMAMQSAEKELELLLKSLAFEAAEYGNHKKLG